MGLMKWLRAERLPAPITSVQRIPTATVPIAPPEVEFVPPPRHQDPGGRFAPKPQRRSDTAVRGVPANLVSLYAPATVPSEVRFQLENGDWIDWRSSLLPLPPSIKIIGYAWRVKGAT